MIVLQRKPEGSEKGNGTSIRSISEKDSAHEELLKVLQSLSKQVAESLDKVTKAVGQTGPWKQKQKRFSSLFSVQ